MDDGLLVVVVFTSISEVDDGLLVVAISISGSGSMWMMVYW